MQYLGGKQRLLPRLIPIIQGVLDVETTGELYWEPFIGGCNVAPRIKCGRRIASDSRQELITMYQSLQKGWVPPDTVTEAEYARVRALNDLADPLTAFVGIGCSWGGKWWGGYARDPKSDRNYARNAKNSLAKRNLTGIEFLCIDFLKGDVDIHGALIYCDPPYEGTTGYGTGAFDSAAFWSHVRELSLRNVVLVSEYAAPEDFVCVAEFETRTDLRTRSGGKEGRIERVFRKKS